MTAVRWIIAVIVCGLITLAALRALKPHEAPPVTVRSVVARRAAITSTVRATGKLEPLRKVNVSANISGTLLDLKVGIGSVVKKGQYLGQIDTSRYSAQVGQQRAQVAAAEAEIRRQEAELAGQRARTGRIESAPSNTFNVGEREQARTTVTVSEAQLSTLKSKAQVTRAALSEAEKSLEWATLRAPVDGTVLSTNHRVGERIRGSDFSEDVVLVIGSISTMEVRIDVGEHDVVHIRPRQRATTTIDALPKVVIEGEVIDNGRDAIIKNPGTDNEVTNYPVWVSMSAAPAQALSGMSAQVTIYTESRPEAIVVPIQAVTVRPREGGGPGAEAPAPAMATAKVDAGVAAKLAKAGGGARPMDRLQKVVFVVKDDKAVKRIVETGISSESHVEISSGLEAGEVVIEGPYRVLARDLKDGVRVTIEKPPDGGSGSL